MLAILNLGTLCRTFAITSSEITDSFPFNTGINGWFGMTASTGGMEDNNEGNRSTGMAKDGDTGTDECDAGTEIGDTGTELMKGLEGDVGTGGDAGMVCNSSFPGSGNADILFNAQAGVPGTRIRGRTGAMGSAAFVVVFSEGA